VKGTLAEAELHLMQQRLRQGRLAKARRGALRVVPPMGYVVRPSGEIALDPDEQVQAVIRLIFRKFAELGTVHALLRYLVAQQIELGMRVHSGPERGAVVWRRPSRATLQDILKHPMYAGAYVYGRRPVDPRRKRAGQPDAGRVVAAPDAWQVLRKDQLPAYISWAQYEQNLARLQANRARADTLGVPREGPALLSRLLVCAYCGRHMAVSYRDKGARHYAYACARMNIDYGAACCQQLAGASLDAFVSQQVLAALEPAALDLSLEAAAHLEQERAELDRLWQQKGERARYEAERAGRQYRLVEPENRLVARQLEREWEEKLAAQLRLEEDYRRFRETQPRGLTADERAAIRQLAADIPALWHAPTTTAAERKELVRQVVQRVVVAVQGESERVAVTIAWVGGAQTAGTLVRPVARFSQLSYAAPLRAHLLQWAEEGVPTAEMARRLNAAGYRPPKRCARFTAPIVQTLLRQLQHRPRCVLPPRHDGPGPDEWWLVELARTLGMPPVTLYHWLRRGGLTARQEEQAPHRWIVWADATEVARLRALHQRPAGEKIRRRWLEEAGDEPAAATTRPAHEVTADSCGCPVNTDDSVG
jgi:hypothetical protein